MQAHSLTPSLLTLVKQQPGPHSSYKPRESTVLHRRRFPVSSCKGRVHNILPLIPLP